MPKYDGSWKVVGLFLIVVAALVIFSLAMMPIHGEICHPTNPGHENCTTENLILVVAWQVKEALNDFSPGFTGLATVAIAVFTVILARVSRQQADALPNLERAYVFVSDATSDDIRTSLTLGDSTVGMFTVKYSFRNHGRTPAILHDIRIGVRCWEGRLPDVNALDRDLYTFTSFIASEEESPRHEFSFPIRGWQYERVKQGTGRIFFYGVLGYMDVFGTHHELGFCAHWNFEKSKFMFTEGSHLNYYT